MFASFETGSRFQKGSSQTWNIDSHWDIAHAMATSFLRFIGTFIWKTAVRLTVDETEPSQAGRHFLNVLFNMFAEIKRSQRKLLLTVVWFLEGVLRDPVEFKKKTKDTIVPWKVKTCLKRMFEISVWELWMEVRRLHMCRELVGRWDQDEEDFKLTIGNTDASIDYQVKAIVDNSYETEEKKTRWYLDEGLGMWTWKKGRTLQ